MVDAKTTSRWYLVVAMGRTAGHLALGISNAAGATLALIPEEFPGATVPLKTLVDNIAGSIIKRLSDGRPYGVAVVAEGLGLSIDPADLSTLSDVERDEHGHIRLAELDLGEIIKKQVQARLVPLQTRACPFVEKPLLNGPATWVKPELVAELDFQQWTEDGSLRAPVFLRLRDDIDAGAVRRVEPKPRVAENRQGGEIGEILTQLESKKNTFELILGADRVHLTHLDRVYWPADPALEIGKPRRCFSLRQRARGSCLGVETRRQAVDP